MRSNRIGRIAARLIGGAVLGSMLFGGGCGAIVQRELEVLLRPEANPLLLRESFLIDVFGPRILSLFL